MGASDDDGAPLDVAPAVFVNDERVPVASQVKDGVWAYVFTGPENESVLSIRAQNSEVRRQWNIPVEPLPSAPFGVDSVKATSKNPDVMLRVKGQNLPPIASLQVATSEGVATLEQDNEGRLWVKVQLESKKTARTILVGLRDTREGEHRLRRYFGFATGHDAI